jgi:hypothetical protein
MGNACSVAFATDLLSLTNLKKYFSFRQSLTGKHECITSNAYFDELYQKECRSQLCTVHIQEVGEVLEMIVSGLPGLGNEPIWSPV